MVYLDLIALMPIFLDRRLNFRYDISTDLIDVLAAAKVDSMYGVLVVRCTRTGIGVSIVKRVDVNSFFA